jgi:T5orf172 domain
MSEEWISISSIAKLHGRHKAAIFKVLDRFSIERNHMRSDDARGQKAAFISQVDYERIKDEFDIGRTDSSETETTSDWGGFLYIIQLEPALDPGRYKIGYASNVQDRLRSHKTSAPFAKIIHQWPCKLLWEKTAIECIATFCERLHTEVFRTSDIASVIDRGTSFFELMPRLAEATTDASIK